MSKIRDQNNSFSDYFSKLYFQQEATTAQYRETAPDASKHKQLAPHEASLLFLLIKTLKPNLVLELGTFIGYSTIHIAKALPDDGKIITIEKSPEHCALATKNFIKAGLCRSDRNLKCSSLNIFKWETKSLARLFWMHHFFHLLSEAKFILAQ